MSIFKETIDPTIQTQLQARTHVISGKNNARNTYLPWYLSKNSWVRMTSFTNYTSGKPDFNGKGTITTKPDGLYTGDNLSKKYILEGGTLYTRNNPNTGDLESRLRSDINVAGGVYGSNIDTRPNGSKDSKYYQTYGIRPMPGITSVSLDTIGAYGSVFETTIKYYAWDIHQLNELELLFMRPGYSVLLEWGWSQYLGYDNAYTGSGVNLPNDFNNTIKLEKFKGVTINPFKSLTQQDIYDQLEGLRKTYRHNYDGMLGYVKNFSWKMMPNGGYECETKLISMGEVINTLKISSNSNNLKNTADLNTTPPAKRAYSYDDYENILLSLKAAGEIVSKPEDNPDTVENENKIYGINEQEYQGKWDFDKNYIPRSNIIEKLKSNGFTNQAEELESSLPYVKEILNDAPDYKDTSTSGDYYEYIPIDVWVALMEIYFNFKVTSKSGKPDQKQIKILPPNSNDLCLAGRDSISIDPTICLISNPSAFSVEFPFISAENYQSPGIQPPVKKTVSQDGNLKISDTYSLLPPYYSDSDKSGKINSIYVNIDLLLTEYKNIKQASDDDGVNFTTYVQNVLNKISTSLGGLNNFSLSSVGRDQNTIKIIDLYYLENGRKSKVNEKYEFDLMGLGSICRNVSIDSAIFQEQSTIVAVAAQSRANLGDIYNSTQVYLNAGLEDRIAVAKWQGDEKDDDSTAGDPNNFFYQKLYDFLVYVKDQVVGYPASNSQNVLKIKKDFAIGGDQNGNPPTSYLKQFMLKYDGEINFKALIPFKLSITLDGIGGIVVGQIFRVKNNVLPKNYIDKNLGFIVTKIKHNLQNNDWTTTLETQICILDQDQFLENNIPKMSKNIERKGFGKAIVKSQVDSIFYNIAYQFIEYQLYKSFVGFLWTSSEDKTIKSGLINHLGFYENSKPRTDSWFYGFQKYWNGQNTEGLNYVGQSNLNLSPSFLSGTNTINNNFASIKFDSFDIWVKEWIKGFRKTHANDGVLDYKLRDKTTTINQALDKVLANTETINQIKSYFIGKENWFWCNNESPFWKLSDTPKDGNSIFYYTRLVKGGYVADKDYGIWGQLWTSTKNALVGFYDITYGYGFNDANIKTRIDSIFNEGILLNCKSTYNDSTITLANKININEKIIYKSIGPLVGDGGGVDKDKYAWGSRKIDWNYDVFNSYLNAIPLPSIQNKFSNTKSFVKDIYTNNEGS